MTTSDPATSTVWKTAVKVTVVSSFLDHRKYLRALYSWQKLHQNSYSYLQFAADLGFPRTNALRLVIAGKRPLSLKAATKIAAALDLTPTQRHYFMTLVKASHARQSKVREQSYAELAALKTRGHSSPLARAQLDFFSAWYHPVIFEMLARPDFTPDPHWLAAQIQPRIRPEQARKSLELLQNLGLATVDATTGRLRATQTSFSSGDDVASLALVRYHQQMLDLGKEAIVQIHEDERDITTLTFCVGDGGAALIRNEVRQFRQRLIDLIAGLADYESVYQLNIQLFPVNQRPNQKAK